MSDRPIDSAIWSAQDIRVTAHRLATVREAVLAGETPSDAPSDAPRAVIGESWRRARVSGVDPDGEQQQTPLPVAELEQRRQMSRLSPVLPVLNEGLLAAADAAQQIMVVTDAEGRVLWREGSAPVRRMADRLGFDKGADWREGVVGTNAIGTALVARRPVLVHSAEHFVRSHRQWTCAAAPLHDPRDGRLLGTVDVSGPAPGFHPTTPAGVHGRPARRGRAAHPPSPHPGAAAVERGAGAGTDRRTGAGRRPARLGRGGDGPDPAGPGGAAQVARGRAVVAAALRHVRPGATARRLADPYRAAGAGHRAQPGGAGRQRPGRLDGHRQRTGRQLVARADPAPCRAAVRARRASAGRSAAELARDLFGDDSRTVTVRAELSRLRRHLASVLAHRPYRFADGVEVELRLPPQPVHLLPQSLAPAVAAARRG